MSFKSSFRIIGLMSGTSLDGLDIVDISLSRLNTSHWEFVVNGSELVAYNSKWREKLESATKIDAPALLQLSHELGCYFAACVNDYLKSNGLNKSEFDAISSHGHTVFHQPDKGFTLQIGNGPELAVHTGITTVCDFRVKDVALGGNGAPLVPIGDQLLFGDQAQAFLNLGGFSNISFLRNNNITAFDICPVNVVLNKIAQTFGQEYDEGGKLGKQGEVSEELLVALNGLDYYQHVPPKSLGVEWVESNISPLLQLNLDFMRTYYEHIAIQIAAILEKYELKSVMISGGGAKNDFLIDRLANHFKGNIIIPDATTVEFKEAIIFGLLGALRLNNEINVLATVTGARQDSCSGVIHTPL